MKNSDAAKAPQDMFGVSVTFGVLGFLAAIISLGQPHAFHDGAIKVAFAWMASAEYLTTPVARKWKLPWFALVALALDSFQLQIPAFVCSCLLAVVLMIRWIRAWLATA